MDHPRDAAPRLDAVSLAALLPLVAPLLLAVLLPLVSAAAAAVAAQEPTAGTERSTVEDPQDAARRVVTLAEAIRLAEERSPEMVGSRSAVSSARADRLEARGAWLPSFTANGIYGNSSNERLDQTTGQLVSENYTAQLQASYEIFSGGRRLARNRIVGAEMDAAEADHRAQRFNTALETTRTFYEAAAATDLLGAAAQRLERARQQLDFAESRLELGTATRSDVLRAEMEVGDAELAVLEGEASLRRATLELGRRIGEEGEVHPAPAALSETAPSLPPLEELVRRAEAASPSVTAAEAVRSSRRAARLAAYTPYLPSVRLSGGYDWFSFEFPPDQQSWSLRLIASLPLFDGMQREAGLQRASAAERTAEATARDVRLRARAEVETAAGDVELAERRVAISDRAVELAREDLRVLEERYQFGTATIVDLQTSQVGLADAEAAAIRARQALGTEVARLESILGEGLVAREER